ncbi:MAG: endonuclease/exonuclease/phosphatase family protein [Burkholderiales bacterium]
MKIRVLSHNIHKGFSHLNRRLTIHELRHGLREIDPDIVFLQEVQGRHDRHAKRHLTWPEEPQYEFLADEVWQDHAYGRNAVYDHGHHGNAILSRYPIVFAENQDVSNHKFERRGLLHCIVAPPQGPRIHCVCVHLSLDERGRRHQIGELITRMRHLVPSNERLLIAGDFNDWRNLAGRRLADSLNMLEAFRDRHGKYARSFPSAFPILRLDRIYTRGFTVDHAQVHHGKPWSRISDHAAISAELVLIE